MHELAMCRAIVGVVDRHAEGRGVAAVHVRVGALRQAVPETLTYCWDITVRGSAYDGTVLDVEAVPATVLCRDCGASGELCPPVVACGSCGSVAVDVTSGDELLVVAIDLKEPA